MALKLVSLSGERGPPSQRPRPSPRRRRQHKRLRLHQLRLRRERQPRYPSRQHRRQDRQFPIRFSLGGLIGLRGSRSRRRLWLFGSSTEIRRSVSAWFRRERTWKTSSKRGLLCGVWYLLGRRFRLLPLGKLAGLFSKLRRRWRIVLVGQRTMRVGYTRLPLRRGPLLVS